MRLNRRNVDGGWLRISACAVTPERVSSKPRVRYGVLLAIAAGAAVCGCRSRVAAPPTNAGFVADAGPIGQDTGSSSSLPPPAASDTGGLSSTPHTDAQSVHLEPGRSERARDAPNANHRCGCASSSCGRDRSDAGRHALCGSVRRFFWRRSRSNYAGTRLGVHRPSGRRHRHECARRQQRNLGQRRAPGWHHVSGKSRGGRRSQRSGGPAHQRPTPARGPPREFGRFADWRVGHRDRQPVRLLPRQHRAERHRRSDQRHGPKSRRPGRGKRRLRRHDSNGCRDQSRKLRRPARQRAGRSHRREQLDLHAERRVRRTRVCHSDQSRQARDRRSARSRRGPPAVDRRATAAE